MELIHSDVCGPMPSTSLSGNEYYVTFINGYSFKKDMDILLENKEWSIREIQGIQMFDREPLRKKNQDIEII